MPPKTSLSGVSRSASFSLRLEKLIARRGRENRNGETRERSRGPCTLAGSCLVTECWLTEEFAVRSRSGEHGVKFLVELDVLDVLWELFKAISMV